MKKAITCASRRTVFCIVALLAISACLGIMAAVLHRPQPAATGLSIRMNDQKIRLFDTPLLLCRNYGLSMEQRLVKRARVHQNVG